jgi:penicillin-binding protein 1C
MSIASVLRGLVGVTLALAAVSGALTSTPAQATQPIPSFAEVRAAHHPSDITLLARDGTPIQTLRVDATVRRLAWVPLEEMSPALLQAIVLSEDRRFYAHSGVDWAAVAQSAWANLWNERTRGASTLTMQLAGLIDDDLARPRGGRSVARKIGQALTATQLEAHWTKSEILEAYLNSVPFRGELVGIGALAQTLFGKHASGLDAQEAALAAALVRGPNARPEVVAQRACGVLRLQQAGAAPGGAGADRPSASTDGRASLGRDAAPAVDPCRGIRALAATAFVRRGGMVLGEQLAPHFARRMIDADANTSGVQRSTLDAPLQRLAVATLREQLSRLAGRNVEDGAIVVLDNRSGEVLAWVGSSGDLSDARQVDGVLARRQPGSTLKPFVYELAFEQRLITPASLIDDAPLQIATPAGLYLPRDYDGQFKGWVSARSALGASLNVPAVRLGAMLGPDVLAARLNAFGLALERNGGYYGSALALGSAEVTLLALTNAYRTLANGGLFTPVRLRPSGETSAAPHRAAQADAVYLVTDILADNNARVRTFGLDSLLATRGFAAVKTGTSSDMRDNWCVGFTDRYTVGVWVGNASGAAMHDVSGISGATPIWQTLVRYLHAGQPSRPPEAPAGVLRRHVTFEAGREPTRDEVFLAGTEQLRQRASAQVVRARRFGIASPRDGSIFAIDPDMPPSAQRIRFEGEIGVWVLDGKRLGTARRWSWAPWPGRHELTLLGRDGQALQTVRFEVRGAGVKSADQTRQ